MGYRHYLYAIPKKQVAEIQSCKTNEDWCNFAENYGYKVDRGCCDDGSGWFSPYKIGTELYELGKYSEIAFKLESERPSLFTSEELKKRYPDYGFALLTKDDFAVNISEFCQLIWMRVGIVSQVIGRMSTRFSSWFDYIRFSTGKMTTWF